MSEKTLRQVMKEGFGNFWEHITSLRWWLERVFLHMAVVSFMLSFALYVWTARGSSTGPYDVFSGSVLEASNFSAIFGVISLCLHFFVRYLLSLPRREFGQLFFWAGVVLLVLVVPVELFALFSGAVTVSGVGLFFFNWAMVAGIFIAGFGLYFVLTRSRGGLIE